MRKAGEMGILGPGVSEEYGGAGDMPLLAACMVGEELSRRSAALSMGVGLRVVKIAYPFKIFSKNL